MMTTQAALQIAYAGKAKRRLPFQKLRRGAPARLFGAAFGRLGNYLDAHPAAFWFAGFVVCPLLVVLAVTAAAFVFSLPLLL